MSRNPIVAVTALPLIMLVAYLGRRPSVTDLCRGPLSRVVQSSNSSIAEGSVARRRDSVSDSFLVTRYDTRQLPYMCTLVFSGICVTEVQDIII